MGVLGLKLHFVLDKGLFLLDPTTPLFDLFYVRIPLEEDVAALLKLREGELLENLAIHELLSGLKSKKVKIVQSKKCQKNSKLN